MVEKLPERTTATERIRRGYESLYAFVDRRLGGRLVLVHRTWLASSKDAASVQARSMAYYALFSLFPLLLFLVSLSGSVLDSQESQQTILSLVERYVPAAQGFVRDNIDQVLRARGTAGVLGVVGLLWAGSGVFGAIYRGVNRAWGSPERQAILMDRLFGLAMVLSLGLFLVATVLSGTVLELMRSWRVPILGWWPFADRTLGILLGWGSALFQAAVSVLVFVVIYRFIPRADVTWQDVWPGGLMAGLAWEAVKRFFTWYLVNAARYSLVYGSVGAIIGFLLWSYVEAMILLVGAEFTAQYSRWCKAGRPVEARPPG
jgi:membrane protein